MKENIYSTFIILGFSLFFSCGNSHENEAIKLSFCPEKGKELKINYDFEVISETSGDITKFNMDISGVVKQSESGNVVVEFKNNGIELGGTYQGKEIHAIAGQSDSVENEIKLISNPVFVLLNKVFRSTFDNKLNKKFDLQMDGENIVDSTENRFQFFIRYPANSVKIGDSWNAEILIKSGNKMNCSATYTLVSVKDEVASISVSGKLYGSGDSFGNAFTIDGKLEGNFNVDIKSGMPLSTEINEEFALKLGENILPMKYVIHSTVE